uniref:glycosyltransferase family 2 protein n=1 Tax=Trichocoleus desertorum TaxID=1481672 RepID=UPI0025B5BA12|nr:glycosyltransferase family 2 protein [Trichocoleus desertorum]
MLDQLSTIQPTARLTSRIAVLVPCHNEALTIAQVVADFQTAMPEAKIYVYDNRSGDDTAEIASAAGAIVRYEPVPGKGNVVRRMFADIEADAYVIVDGDNTYEAGAVRHLVTRLLDNQLDMVVGVRRSTPSELAAYRRGHRGGALMLTYFVRMLFGAQFSDMLSGYRVFSRRFVKSFPALSNGFEIETEFTVHALELKMPFAEEPTWYKSRPPGSTSKLKTFSDGWRIVGTALLLFKEVRPLLFFGLIFLLLAFISVLLSIPVLTTFWETGLVPRFPTAILSASIMLLAFLSLTCGMVLDSVARGRREAKRMIYLSYSAPGTRELLHQ